jgi:hypothetical protein
MEALHDLSASLDESISVNRRYIGDEDELSEDSDRDFDNEEDENDGEDALFGEVRRHGHSGSAQQRQLCAILEAVRISFHHGRVALIFIHKFPNFIISIYVLFVVQNITTHLLNTFVIFNPFFVHFLVLFYTQHHLTIEMQVSGVLDEQKQAPTPTAYFAVLMTALSSPQSLAAAAPPAPAKKAGRQARKGSRAKQAVAAALLHLLHLVLPEYDRLSFSARACCGSP